MLDYQLWLLKPSEHIFDVELIIKEPKQKQICSLPAWIPGSYMIREFSKNIVQIKATDDDGPCQIDKLDKHTWCFHSHSGPMHIRYEVYGWDLSVRMAHFDHTHAFINGTSVFLKAHDFENMPHRIHIHRPTDPKCHNWRVATAMRSINADPTSFGQFEAENYDELIDHPIEISDYTRIEFDACGVPHEMVITGTHRADEERLKRDLQKICEEQIRFFGAPAPMDRYLFLTMALGGYGGLEHRASTSLLCSRESLPQRHEAHTLSEKYKTFLGLCSHEYFHTWNVKRIRPATFTPYDLSTEGYTTLLWAFEGITSYYDDLILHRCGLIDTSAYLGLLSKTASRVFKGEGRKKQSLADSSFYAWTKFYRQDENAPNAIVSYYAKGALVALALDLHIRIETNGRCTLDNIMKMLWNTHGKPNIGVPEDGVEKIAKECSGLDLNPFFQSFVHGTEDPPLEELLRQFGVSLTRCASEKEVPEAPVKSDLGIRTVKHPYGAKIANVYDGGAAQLCGLSAGDIIISVNRIKTDHSQCVEYISTFPPGTNITIHAFHRDELTVFEAVPQEKPRHIVKLELISEDELEETVLLRRQSWLTPGESL